MQRIFDITFFAQKWFDNLKAPHKEFIKIKNAANMVNFEQPNE